MFLTMANQTQFFGCLHFGIIFCLPTLVVKIIIFSATKVSIKNDTETQKHKNTKTQKHKNTKTQIHVNTKTQNSKTQIPQKSGVICLS